VSTYKKASTEAIHADLVKLAELACIMHTAQ